MAIVERSVEVSGLQLPEALRSFGRFCMPKLAARHQDFFEPHAHPKIFLKTVDFIHQTEVKKLYKDAEPPSFTYDDPAPDRLTIHYRSKRRLCHFMEGLLDEVADYFESPIRHRQISCMLDGAETCELILPLQLKQKGIHERRAA